MPAKRPPPVVPFQTVTRSSATQTPVVVPETADRGRVASATPNRRRPNSVPPPLTPATPRVARVVPLPPLVSPARERAQVILDRHRIADEMADQQQLIAALQALTNQLGQDQAAQVQNHNQLAANNQNLLNALQQHLNLGAGAGAGAAAPPPPPQITPLLVESIPKFEGSATDFPQDFVDHVNRIGDAEGWNDQQKIQVAARRLEKTALEWHVHSGHAHATWALWSAALLNSFAPRIPYGQWMSMVEKRRQRPGESGMEYALEKRKLLRLAPVPLDEAQIIAFLISGLAKWQHEAALSANRPDDFGAFLTRIRELEAMDVSSGPVYPAVAPTGVDFPLVHAAVPPPVPPPVVPGHLVTTLPPYVPVHPSTPAPVAADVARLLSNFQDRLIADLTARFAGVAGGRGHGAPPGASGGFGRGRGGRGAGPDLRSCYVCGRAGHISRDCPEKKI